jgi:LuxR family maltose regulon positive regulatory protein
MGGRPRLYDATVLESTRPAASVTPGLGGILLAGKVAVRPARQGAVSRRRLIDSARSHAARIVGVTAPAGYGKSTMLAEWAATESRPVAWASLDRLDDDPVTLLTLLATASATVSPRAAEVVAEMRGVGSTPLARSAPMLAAALTQASGPFVLFVDDVHTVPSLECQDVLEVVLGGVPEGSQVVLASRHEQSYLARLRIDATTREIGVDELRIDGDGARTIFDEAGVAVSDDDLAAVVERCEGWPTGIFLCALAVGGGVDVPAMAGDERLVADYLYHECLAGLPEDLRSFLRRTAVLDELSGALCDAVLESGDSRAILRRLETLGLFLVPLDRRRQWFRYHSLFREFLLAELDRLDSGMVAELHRRAADWFEQQDAPERAVEHLLAAGDGERAGALIADLALPAYQHGRIAVIDRWFSQLGDPLVEASPVLAVLAAWSAVLQGRSPESERWAAVLERIDPEGSAEDRAAFESARAMVRAAMCVDGPEQVLADATLAVASEPDWSPWRDQALHLLGSARLLAGDRAGARDAFVASSACAVEAGNSDSVLLCEAELAILAIDEGAWADAESHAHTAVRAIDDNHMEGYPTSALALAVSARLALRRGDTAAGERLLARAMRARVHCTHVLPYLAMRVRLQLAKVFAGMGDRAAARHMLREIDGLLARRPHVGVLAAEIDRFRTRLNESAGRVSSVPLTPAELRLLPYLQTHLSIAEIGKRLYISRNTVSTEVGSIYRKLGVTTRGAAVDRAIESGLLGE